MENNKHNVSRMETILKSIQLQEGGYWNDPYGGQTNFGITQNTLNRVREKNPAFPANVKDLTVDDAAVIIEVHYLIAQKVDRLPEPLDLVVGHTVVMSWDDGVRIMQDLVDVESDGIIGPITLRAVEQYKPKRLALSVLAGFIEQFEHHDYIEGYRNRAASIFREII